MLVHGLILSVLALAAPQDALPQFRCTILQSSGGFGATVSDINARGEAVGCVLSPTGSSLVAAYWSPTGALTVLGDPTVPISSGAAAINDDGAIVGSRGLWKKLQPVHWSLVDGGHPIAGPRPSAAGDVNSRGDILFHVPTATGAAGLLRERDGRWIRIESPPLTQVVGLSDERKVAGNRLTALGLAFRWSESSGIEDLALPAGFIESSANGISEDDSQVVGWGVDAAGVHALTWDALGNPHVLPYGALQTTDARAIDINASDWVVGTHVGFLTGGVSRLYGTLWANAAAYELESLIQAGPLVEVRVATSINDKGQIVATGFANGQPCLVRLDPL